MAALLIHRDISVLCAHNIYLQSTVEGMTRALNVKRRRDTNNREVVLMHSHIMYPIAVHKVNEEYTKQSVRL